MIKVREDLTGKIFGRLTVIRQIEDYIEAGCRHRANWLCECSCKEHNKIEVVGDYLKKRRTTSCGCYQKERAIEIHKKYNIFSDKLCDEYGEYYIGYASNTNQKFYIDAEDYDKIKNYCWYEDKRQSASILRTQINGRPILMHQFLGFKNYDHIDRNELNNRKYNLRKCTIQENNRNRGLFSCNTSGFIGVSWYKNSNQWRAQIVIDKKQIYLGSFVNKIDAIKARLQAERDYFGEFAPQQHLFEQYGIELIINQND